MALLFYNEYMTLKEIRISKGLTQKEVSELLNIPLRTYKRIESDYKYHNSLKYALAVNSLKEIKKNNKTRSSTKVVIVGAGYVGFSIAVLLSTFNKVTVIDIDNTKIERINVRKPLFYDPLIESYLHNKHLNLSASLPNKDIYKKADIVIIATPTNYIEENEEFDMSNVTNVIKDVREVNKESLIVIKSTCYIGYTETLNDRNVIFSPEFLREGKALHDNLFPSRIIIGGNKNEKTEKFASLLIKASKNNPQILYMSSKEAEAVKLFSNAYLAMRVSYFNELDSFAIKHNMNTNNIIDGVSLDPRIGDYYNNPSFGYGGYCLPKDTSQLESQFIDVINNDLITSITKSNESRKDMIVKDIINKLGEPLNNKTVGVYSLLSKVGTDSVRRSAIYGIIDELREKGVNILIYKDMSFEEFINNSDLILANRYSVELEKVKEKVYTRDLFNRD